MYTWFNFAVDSLHHVNRYAVKWVNGSHTGRFQIVSSTKLHSTGRAEKRDLIIRAAAAQFNKQGFNDTRLEDVAVVLETSKTSISYHFKSKQALLEKAYEESCSIHGQLIERANAASSGLAKVSEWITGLGEIHSAILSGRMGNIAFLNDLTALEQSVSDRFARQCGAHYAAISGFLEEGKADGTVDPSVLGGATYFIWNSANWLEDWLAAIPAQRHAIAVRAFAGLISQGLATDRAAQFETSNRRSIDDTSGALFDREARARLKKDAFERSGIRKFNRSGYASLSLNALASDLGASRGTFYYTFADKDALLESCIERSLRQYSNALDRAASSSRTAVKKLHLVCTALYAGHFSDLDPLLRPSLLASLSNRKRAVAEAEVQNIAARFARLIADCFEDDSGSTKSVERLDLVILEVLNSIAITRNLQHPGGGKQITRPPGHEFFHALFKGVSRENR